MAFIEEFYLAGISYKKTEASVRSKFSIGTQQYASILQKAKQQGIQEICVVSTCNRTEIFGRTHSAQAFIELLCSETEGNFYTFHSLSYTLQGWNAVEHLFSVAAGLDSQIIGDYEIVGQIKKALQFSKQHGCMKGITERLMNTVLQCAKAIKTQTKLSSGTVSVSFAAIQYLKQKLRYPQQASIAIVGTGKIGSSTCKNLIDYLGSRNITLINRSEEKACQLAQALQIQYAPLSALHHVIKNIDVVIVATNAAQPVLQAHHVADGKNRILIDLSIPQNIDIAARYLPNIEYIQVDDLSKINDTTLQQRMAEIPKAKKIIVEAIHEFAAWLYERKHAATLRTAREKLIALHRCPYLTSPQNNIPYSEPSIQKIINQMAVNIRQQPAQQQGCYFLKVMNDYITNNLQ